ncbi:signal peptidase I [Williamsia sp. 1135]|uniref:signal peptidase I n=1 Tax=Williamsia sp. 1135 TaxID=1889262 RepID=UPI000A10B5B9|nr:signal peptidase I [Williamsia sp. 1135]ORM36106.1 signal peptidase I [Williamsia sp. 1135]
MTVSVSADESTGLLWWVRTVLSWAFLFAMLSLLAITFLIPAAGSAERFTVLTGSMQPTYAPGTLIIVKPADADDLRIGDAITYQLQSGRPAVVTHRIVATSQNTLGERTYTTKGDANDVADPKPVVVEQIRGEVWYSIPYLGYVNNWVTGQHRTWVIGAIVTALFSYAILMTGGSIRDRRRMRCEPADVREVKEDSDHGAQR